MALIKNEKYKLYSNLLFCFVRMCFSCFHNEQMKSFSFSCSNMFLFIFLFPPLSLSCFCLFVCLFAFLLVFCSCSFGSCVLLVIVLVVIVIVIRACKNVALIILLQSVHRYVDLTSRFHRVYFFIFVLFCVWFVRSPLSRRTHNMNIYIIF